MKYSSFTEFSERRSHRGRLRRGWARSTRRSGFRGSRHIAYGFLPSAAERLEKDDGGAS